MCWSRSMEVTLRLAQLVLRAGRPSQNVTNHLGQLFAFHPSGYTSRVPACLAEVEVGHVHLCRVAVVKFRVM